jgi:alpha/beta superfamily hydrolase
MEIQGSLASHRVHFIGSAGRMLGGILDRPPHRPAGFIVLAHCFTCSKDLKASVRISRGLAQRGWGVLRFDFAGLGNSEGDFAMTNLASNKVDLSMAIDYLRQQHEAPFLLVGHSFGGVAALAVAQQAESIRGLVTIAAPSETSHLADVLLRLDPAIETTGRGEVMIGGRKFPIDRQMIEEFRRYDLGKDLETLNKPLLLLHSPDDETVAYEHARQIYQQVSRISESRKEPPEVGLFTLPRSDHLLVRDPRDLPFVIAIIDAWARRLMAVA